VRPLLAHYTFLAAMACAGPYQTSILGFFVNPSGPVSRAVRVYREGKKAGQQVLAPRWSAPCSSEMRTHVSIPFHSTLTLRWLAIRLSLPFSRSRLDFDALRVAPLLTSVICCLRLSVSFRQLISRDEKNGPPAIETHSQLLRIVTLL
jgi:hypothetical protein